MSIAILATALGCAVLPGAASPVQHSPVGQAGSHTPPPPDARVDINSASPDQLMTIPGMKRTWAARIIRYRPYRAKNELVDRGIVTSEVYDHIKDYIIAHRAKP